MKLRLKIFFVVVCLLSLPFVAGCGGIGGGGGGAASLNGMVVDSRYKPLSGVTVVAGSKMTTSLSDGTYNIPAISNGPYVIIYTEPGYTTSYRKITVSGSTVHVPLVILTPLDGKSTLIDSSGGIVSNTDASVKITIPANTLEGSIPVSLTRVETFAAPYPPPADWMFIAVIVFISPDSVDLDSNKGILSIPNITGLSSGTIVPFYHFSVDDCDWELLPDSGIATIGVPSGSITAEISAFGWTAAIVQYAPNAGNITGTIRDPYGDPIPNAYVWRSAFSTVADSFGTYLLSNVPTGEATVEAIASGYLRNFISVNVPVGGTVNDADITLTPVSTGTIMGNIFEEGTSDGVPGARVVAQPSGMQTTADDNGNYTLYNVRIGAIDVYAYANGFIGNHSSGSLPPDGLTMNIGLTRTQEAQEWFDNFETSKGWVTVTDEARCVWRRKQNPQSLADSLSPVYVTLQGSWNLPSSYSGSYCYWFGTTVEGTSPEGCYVGVQDPLDSAESGGTTLFSLNYVRGSVVSPMIDITSFAYGTLSFWTWWELESMNIATGYDMMCVEVGEEPYNTSDWHVVGILNPTQDPDQSQKRSYLPYSSGGFNQPGAWVRHTFDITSYVGNRIKIRFRFDSVDNKYNGFRGWLIDDVKVSPSQIGGFSVSEASVDKRPDKGKSRRLSR